MNEGIQKFRELLLTDEAFQKKLQEDLAGYTGEQTVEAIFNNVLLPLGQEQGINASFEEFQKYLHEQCDQEMQTDELAMVAGGTKGIGANLCYYVGLGLGLTDNDPVDGTLCVAIGLGEKCGQACMKSGVEI